MFPAQTSLIPAQVALARFLENQGFEAIFANYPYWYLGTTPFRYLTGPVIPFLLTGFHKIFPSLSLFSIFYLLITICWLIGGVGVYWLTYSLANSSTSEEPLRVTIRGVPLARWTAFLAAVFYLFGPIVPFLFRFSDGIYLIAFSFLPLTLLMYLKFLQPQKRESGQNRKNGILLCLLIAFVILLDSLIIPTLLLGMAALLLATGGWQRIEERLKRTFLIFTFSFLISTLWYTPSYWLTLLGAPSLAGKGLTEVIVWLGKLLPTALALIMAIFSIKLFKKRFLLRDFCFYWLFIFGFLTLMRFLSDPDFWLDWSSYNLELQFGLGIVLGMILNGWLATQNRKTASPSAKTQNIFASSKFFCVFAVPLVLFGTWLLLFNRYVLGTLQRDISKTVEYRIGSQLSQIVKPGETVFLSGTTAFWLNAFFDIPQVRGGRDQVSLNQDWRKVVWEVREGEDPLRSLEWLKKLGVDYLVVHSSASSEFYHDFVHPEKFEGIPGSLKKIYDERGDKIYQVLE